MDGEGKATQTGGQAFHWGKYNTKISGPKYTDEQYETQLKSDTWSKEETEYLIDLCVEYDLRWIVIADRYEFQPKEMQGNGDAMAVTLTARPRNMEDMKARYYEVAAKMMAITTPLSSMSEAEFALHEKMAKFDPNRETTRKRLAEALMARSPEEIREEEILLGELKRIVTNEDRFLQERKELYTRLDHPVAQGSIAMYESSAGLVQLMQTLLSQDKNKKRRSLMGPGDTSSPAQGQSAQGSHGPGHAHRPSLTGQSHKKGQPAPAPTIRKLTSREEDKYGVQHHERLSSGILFRQHRIDKLTLAKSTTQQIKLHGALAELGIPVKAIMPTTKVCAEYESLVQNVHLLLDVRKVGEKTANEIGILRKQKITRGDKGSGVSGSGEGQETDNNNDETQDKDEIAEDDTQIEENADHDAEAEHDEDDAEADGDADVDDENDGEQDAENKDNGNDDVEVEEDEEEADPDVEAEVDEEEDEEEEDEDEQITDQEEDSDQEEDHIEEDEENDVDVASVARSTKSLKSTKSGRSHKRGASVMSGLSESSTKRQKK